MKPLEVPSSVTAGGAKAKTIASLIWLKAPIARPATAFTESSSPRSSQSLRFTKAMPAFWPEPPKLKPCTVKIDLSAVFSFSMKCFSTFFITSMVRSCVAPTGAFTIVKSEPWSSSGRNEVGRRRKHHHHHRGERGEDEPEALRAG